ncbi:MAG: ABC transporter ATP-binding protein [Desulfurococcaceae archaeon]
MISLRRVKVVYYPPGVEAVKEATLDIPEKAVTCIVGPNASGKTSLLKAISALVKYEGGVYIDGKEARSIVKLLRRILSYACSLSTSADYLGARVLDVLLFSRYPVSKGFMDSREDIEEVYRVSKLLSIEHLLYRRLGELSSGEFQRVLLAAALVKNPRILLLDEPDAHLDPAFKAWLSEFLRGISSEKTVVLTTHDTTFASSVCDYVVVMSEGRVIYTGTMGDLAEKIEYLEKAYKVSFSVVQLGDRRVLVPNYVVVREKTQVSP